MGTTEGRKAHRNKNTEDINMTKKQRIEEKIKMLENGISATEQMTEEDCAEIYGIPKET